MTTSALIIANFGKWFGFALGIVGIAACVFLLWEMKQIGDGIDRDRDENR